jgi:hypothetical protein
MFIDLFLNDISLSVGIIGVILAILFPAYEFYKSKQVKLDILGDISSLDRNKVLITISNIGKINTRISNIGFGFNLTREKWYKPGTECQNLYPFWNLKSEQEIILASNHHISVPFDLIKIRNELRHAFKSERKEQGNVSVKRITGWVYLPKPKKTLPKSEDDEFGLEVSDSTYKRFKINYSEQLETHLKEFLRE